MALARSRYLQRTLIRRLRQRFLRPLVEGPVGLWQESQQARLEQPSAIRQQIVGCLCFTVLADRHRGPTHRQIVAHVITLRQPSLRRPKCRCHRCLGTRCSHSSQRQCRSKWCILTHRTTAKTPHMASNRICSCSRNNCLRTSCHHSSCHHSTCRRHTLCNMCRFSSTCHNRPQRNPMVSNRVLQHSCTTTTTGRIMQQRQRDSTCCRHTRRLVECQ